MPTDFKVGAGKADITDTRQGLIFAGYAYDKQKSSGNANLPLFARAFAIEENRSSGTRHLCMVVVDCWGIPEPIKTEVLKNLPAALKLKLNRRNLVISATHTHAGPGGYTNHFLYSLVNGGLDKVLLKKMVDGIVAAIRNAFAVLRTGRIYAAQGELVGCGDNRSIAAYRANAEGQAADAFDRRTDRTMTVLRFTHEITGGTESEIGLYTIFAIHPTNLGMFNVDISGDNKGWASKLCEDGKPQTYVAAFANANAGDVSPNVTVNAAWQTQVNLPEGGPAKPNELAANIASMRAMGQKQADKALALAAGPMTELTGRLDHRCTHLNMSDVAIGTKRTAKAALGVSFAAGSREDSMGVVTVAIIGDFKPEIMEGMTRQRFAAGKLAARTILGEFIAGRVEGMTGLASAIGAAALIIGSGKLDDVRADPDARSWVFGSFAKILFPEEVESLDPQASSGATWEWNVPHEQNWPAAYVTAHAQKPIMFPVGITELKKRQNGNRSVVDAPLVPHVIPLQVIKIGGLVLACMPGEWTTVAGYRLKTKLKSVFGASATHVGMVGYSNDYAFYVTTPEEYAVQAYEGAATLYGPNTLAAFIQEVGKLANALKNGQAVTVGQPVPPPAVYLKM
jgi:neutral ceramidase